MDELTKSGAKAAPPEPLDVALADWHEAAFEAGENPNADRARLIAAGDALAALVAALGRPHAAPIGRSIEHRWIAYIRGARGFYTFGATPAFVERLRPALPDLEITNLTEGSR